MEHSPSMLVACLRICPFLMCSGCRSCIFNLSDKTHHGNGATNKLLPLTPLRVAEVRVFGCGSIPEGTNRNIHFPGSSNNLPASLSTYSQARTEHQQNHRKTAGHKTRLNLRKVPPNGTRGTQENRIKLTKGSPLKQAKHTSAPVPRKDQHRERRTQANEPTRRRPTDTRQRPSHDVQGCQQGSSL